MAESVVRLTIEGLPATVRKLEQLPIRIQKRAMMKAIRAGGNVFVKAAKRNAPRATGLFKRSLDQKVKSYRGGQIVVSITGQKSEVKNRKKLRKGRGGISGRGDLVPIHFVEEDTKPHRIPKEGRGPITLQLPSGQRVTVQSVQHPGTRGTHPMRRAADSSEGAAALAFGEKLRIETDVEVGKLAAEK